MEHVCVWKDPEVGWPLTPEEPSVALTCAPELLAFDLADAFVGQPARVAAARAAGLDGIVEQEVGQPLQVTVAHEGILGQVAGGAGRQQQQSSS